MSAQNPHTLHTFGYDPLDRHVNSGDANGPATQVFYCKDRVAVEMSGDRTARIVETEHIVLAQHTAQGGASAVDLIASDNKRSTLAALNPEHLTPVTFSVYGYPANAHRLPGFNGERYDPLTGYYLLGNGYRAFNPVLMRFNSPDSWSPFGKGGINAYAYCEGDPVNRVDPTGHTPLLLKQVLRRLRIMKPTPKVRSPINKIDETIDAEIRAAHLQKKTRISNLKNALQHEGEKAVLNDQIAELSRINALLIERNNALARQLQLRRPLPTAPPPVPRRPLETLPSLNKTPRRLDYLDLEQVRKT